MLDSPYTLEQRNKLGNALIYLANRIGDLSKTKALKLIYYLEEISIQKYAMPFFNIEFQVWKLGPVVRDLYIDIDSPDIFSDFIRTTKNADSSTYITANKEFCDDEFSDSDIHIMDTVIQHLGHRTATDLIELTHREGHPWHVTAMKHGLIELFDKKLKSASDISVDMSIVLNDNSEKKEAYLHNLEMLNELRKLKDNDVYRWGNTTL